MDEEHNDEIRRIKSNMCCRKSFRCISMEDGLCKARDIYVDGYLECLEAYPQVCDFAISFGLSHLCSCPMRNHLAHNPNPSK